MTREVQAFQDRLAAQMADPSSVGIAARCIIAACRALDETMPLGFSGDPAKMILLDLFVEHENGGARTLADLVSATGMAPALLARWCRALEQEGFVQLSLTVGLTEDGVRHVGDMVRAVIASQVKFMGMLALG